MKNFRQNVCKWITAIMLGMFPAIALAQGHWPEFRGPHGDGHAISPRLPLHWSESKNVAWKTPISGRAWSSPVVWKNQIWLSNATADGKILSAICIDVKTGKLLCNQVLFEIAEPEDRHEFNSYASPTPVIEEGRVYLHFGSSGTACLDTRKFSRAWQRQDLPCNHLRGSGSSPLIWKDLLILTFDGADYQYLVALDKHSGKTVWRTDRNIDYGADKNSNGDFKKAYSTPAVKDVEGTPMLVSVSAAATIAYDARDGKELWRVPTGGYNSGCRPVFFKDLMIGNSEGGMSLFAIRYGAKSKVFRAESAWTYPRGAPARSSPLVVGDLVFANSDAGVLSCLEGQTGKAVWQKRLEGDYSASSLFADGRIYFCNQDGLTTVVAASRDFQKLAENVLDGGCMASPAVSGDSLILRTETHVYRIEHQESSSR
jgi:outer membrane protein assembly factor BamB